MINVSQDRLHVQMGSLPICTPSEPTVRSCFELPVPLVAYRWRFLCTFNAVYEVVPAALHGDFLSAGYHPPS